MLFLLPRLSLPSQRLRSARGSRALRLAGLLIAIVASASPAFAAWTPEDVDLTRPRLLFRAGDVPELHERLQREPYRTLFRQLLARAAAADDVPLEDQTLAAHRFKARAAKNLAFAYALDRTTANGDVVPFPDDAARQAVGDRVRELLVNLFPRSRMAVPPPLGGWDRDISSSEELLQYATAYDTMLGAGYDFGADDAIIIERLTDLASELLLNYVEPETGLEFLGFDAADLHQNNHRSKVGAALVATAIALAEQTPDPLEDPKGVREPTAWIEFGLDQMDLIVRWALTAGDGVYGEGPHYLAFAAQNLHPVLRAWDRLVDGRTWQANGLEFPSLWRHPLFRASQRWALDMTLPDGSKPPLDDSFVERSYPFGTAPRPDDPALAAAFAWRWANAPEPYQSSGNVDLAADAIVNFVDDVVPAPPPGSPTAFYLDGGHAALRSDWSPDAIVAIVVGEHDTASEFGLDRDGLGVAPQSHEHEDPGSFLLHAFGERLLMDPGMVDFALFNPLGRPPAHNVILVNGEGPEPYLFPSIIWTSAPEQRPVVDGHATLHDPLDSGFLDAVSVVTRYGTDPEASSQIRRRFLFPDHRYLVVVDEVDGAPDAQEITWLLHGNGGATSGGDFSLTDVGGRWSRPLARIDSGIDFADAEPRLDTVIGQHEVAGRVRRDHVVLRAHRDADRARALQILYPTPASSEPPALRRLSLPGVAAVGLEDVDGDRRIAAAFRDEAGAPLLLPAETAGLAAAESDGRLLVVDGHLDGRLRVAWAEAATTLRYGDVRLLDTATPGRLGVRPGDDRIEIVVENADAVVEVPSLDFEPTEADGACALHRRGDRVFVELGRERRVTLRASGDPGRPAADPGPDRRAAIGETIVLDGSASCDANGEALRPRWELVSAAPGSDWEFEGADTFRPRLHVDRAGPYRARLLVTNESGEESLPAEVLVLGGPPCADRYDGNLNGLIDSDDPDCATPLGGDNTPPVAAPDLFSVSLENVLETTRSVLDNDGDADGDAITAVLDEPPAHGQLLLLADGRFFYEAGPDFPGSDQFRYRARDARGAESAPAFVTLEGRAADTVSLAWWGNGFFWTASGPLAEGDVAIHSDARGRLRGITGDGRIEDRETEFELDVRRVFLGPLFWGRFEVRDAGLPNGGRARGAGFAHLVRDGDDGVRGWMLALAARPPFFLFWDVRDRR